jgi:hypothetical protein
MGTLKKLKHAGLKDSLEALYAKFISNKADADSRKKLDEAIDGSGLKSPKTMQLVGTLQREGKLQPGLYKELVSLNQKFEGSNGAAQEQPEPSTDGSSEEKKPGEEEMSDKKQAAPVAAEAEAPADDKSNVVSLEGFSMTDKDKEKLKVALQKEEEKVRQRMLRYEQKQVERMKTRAEKRAQRQGLKLEQLQAIKECKDQTTILREEIKERKVKVAALKEQLKALRPKREKKEGEEAAPADKAEKAKKTA